RLRQTKDDLPSIRMRIGINTGPVVVGSLGDDLRVEFKAVGDTVVLAARLEQIAESGQTYVSRDVFRATEGYFNFEVLEPTMVKGKVELVQIYRVTGTKKTPERSVGIGSSLVGRERTGSFISSGLPPRQRHGRDCHDYWRGRDRKVPSHGGASQNRDSETGPPPGR